MEPCSEGVSEFEKKCLNMSFLKVFSKQFEAGEQMKEKFIIGKRLKSKAESGKTSPLK